MVETILDVRNVSKQFRLSQSKSDSFKATISSVFKKDNKGHAFFDVLSDVTFSIKQGEVVGIIGRNGAGKSTLLKILSGVMSPDSGEIDFYGKPASILDIGAGFHPELTGRENIYLASSLHRFSKAETDKRFQQIVDFSGIQNFIDQPVKNYSAGMYLRLAFSVVAHIDADVFIFDEVLAVGDTAFQMKCRKKFEEIIHEGKSVVMVSHNLAEVAKFADRVIFLQDGKIHETGEAVDVIDSYIKDTVQKEYPTDTNNKNAARKIENDMEGCAFFDALKISIHVDRNESPEKFSTSDSIIIKIEINRKTNRGIIPGLFVSDINDSIALTSTTLNSTIALVDSGQQGKQIFTVTFPPNYFNNTIVVFSFFFVVLDDSQQYTGAERIPVSKKLMVSFEEGMPVMKDIKKMPGTIRPELEWKILK